MRWLRLTVGYLILWFTDEAMSDRAAYARAQSAVRRGQDSTTGTGVRSASDDLLLSQRGP